MLEFAEAPARIRGRRHQLMDLTHLSPFLSADSAVTDALRWLIHLPGLIFDAYASLLASAAEWVRDLFDRYGYWVVFLGTLCENTLLVGLVVPGVIVILLAGLSAHEGAMDPAYAAALGIAGAVIGDSLSYLMGRFGWTRLAEGTPLRAFTEKVRDPLLKRGPMFVLLYHFAGYTRVVGPTAAGLLRMPYLKWAPFDHAGAALWVTSFIGIGYGLGAAGLTLDSTDKYFRLAEWGLLALVALWLTLFLREQHRSVLARIADAWKEASSGAAEPSGATAAHEDGTARQPIGPASRR
jgi:membrane-associated protein